MTTQCIVLVPKPTENPTLIYTPDDPLRGAHWALHLDDAYSWTVYADAPYYRKLALVANELAEHIETSAVCS